MIYVIATMKIKPEMRAAVLAAAQIAIAETRKEQGCQSYDMLESTTEPNTFTFVERWDDRDRLTAHMGMPHFKEWRKTANEAVISRKIEIIAPEKVDVM
jgi:quinol monooxygenase YgiN